MDNTQANIKKSGIFKRIALWTFALIFVVFISFRIYYSLTDDFRISNITYEMPFNHAWVVEPLNPQQDQQIQQILDQTFTYIGKGAQAYAFVSADDKYVLKFFKFKHLRPSFFTESLPDLGPLKTYKDKLRARKKRKLLGVFNAYKLAYDFNKEESGLLFVQLNVSGNPQRTVTIQNKLGMEYPIDIQNIPFVLQKKGATFRTILTQLLAQRNLSLAEKRIGQIFDLYALEYAKGIYDHDHGVMHNFGFVDDQPFHLDVGKLNVETSMQQKEMARTDAELVSMKIKRWINKNYPDDYPQLANFIDRKVDELFK